MTKNELLDRLKDIEWEDFEVKEAKTEVPKSSWDTVSAFANTNGGWLIFGIAEKGKNLEVRGVQHLEKIEQDFLNVIRGEKFNKTIEITAHKYHIDDSDILAFHIPESEENPIYFNKRSNTFIRSGSADRRWVN